MAVSRYIVGGLLLALAINVQGADPKTGPASWAMRSNAPDSHTAFTLTLTTPSPEVSSLADGSFYVRIPGFNTLPRRVGAPDIPTKTLLVAIPPDAEPTLEVRGGPISQRPTLRPAPVARRYVEVSPTEREELERPGQSEENRQRILSRAVGTRREADPRIYGGRHMVPAEVAWLGPTGFLRGQRYVELHLAPVRYDPRIDGLAVQESLEVVVHFNPGESTPAAAAPVDPIFEDAYRKAFVNYDQSRYFRSSSAHSPSSTEPVSAIGARSIAETTPRRRILVRDHGVIRLDEAQLLPTGFLAYDLTTWRLTNRDVAVPWHTNDDGDGLIEPGEWIEFYGQALDDEPKTELNTDFPTSSNDLYEARDFTDVNTYFLTIDAPGQPTIAQVDATPTFTRTPPTQFRDLVHLEVDDAYRPLGAADPWYWLPTLSLTAPSREDTVALPGLVAGTDPATVRVHVRGISEDLAVDPDHLTRVTLRNATNKVLGTVDGAFDRRTLYMHQLDWTWPGSGDELTDPVRVELEVLDSGATCYGSPCNSVILDYLEVGYERTFTAVGDELVFEWPDANAEFVIGGLSDPSPEILEITLADGEQVVQPVLLVNYTVTGSGPYQLRFRVDEDPGLADGSLRRFIVAGDGALIVPPPEDFEADTVSDLRENAQQADWIVIAHPDVLDQGVTAPLAQLMDYRATPARGGLTSKLVMLQDVEDEFNQGLPGPLAVREFLRWVISDLPGEGWADPKPSFVLLLGDGSTDYKGGTAEGSFIPTQVLFKDDPQLGYYASDNVMAAVLGADQIPDLMIGRIPARDTTDANLMLKKVLDYEQSPPAGPWQNRALFIADRGKAGNNPGEALQFELINDNAEQMMSVPPFDSRVLRYWTEYFDTPDPTPWDSINADIKDTVNGQDGMADGAALVQYIGHGNFVIWSDDYYFDERINPPSDTFQDSMDLTNVQELPWLMAHNCLTGGFHVTQYNSLGENWIKLDGGGAMAVFAPTGLSYNFVGSPASESIFDDLFGRTKQRVIGPVVVNALAELCGRGSIESCQAYTLQGDPATRLVLRDVLPPSDLQATPGDARVDLSWTASATAGVTYDVYRSDRPDAPLNGLAASGLPGTTYADVDVVNADTYYYHLVAVDPEGFESRWSNLNSDCASSGPDCVQATPLNPLAPAPPGGLQVTDPGLGHVLELTWLASSESDIERYTLHYGTASEQYSVAVETGLQTGATITGLTEGQPYFFAVTATNTSQRTSAYSLEASDFPVYGLGLRNPSFIGDLIVSLSASDVVLDWTEVTTDIFGKPKSVTRYEILRGTAPDYSVESMVEIGQCISPCDSFTDPGAADAGENFHYRVRAVDGDGNVGGIGSEPPSSASLDVAKSTVTPGDVVLSWAPVTTTVDGTPAQIKHYLIYAADAPFTREAIRDGLLSPTVVVGSSIYEFTPPSQNRYYAVLAVDIRGNVSPF